MDFANGEIERYINSLDPELTADRILVHFLEKVKTQSIGIQNKAIILLDKHLKYYGKTNLRDLLTSVDINEDSKLQYQIIEKMNSKFKIICLEESKQIMVFQDNHFSFNRTALDRFISREIRKADENQQFIFKEVEKWIQSNLQFPMRKLNFDSDYIPFRNGYYVVSNKKFYECTQFENFHFIYSIPHTFKQDKKYNCPKFKKLLVEWIDAKKYDYNPKTRRYDLRVRGYRLGKRKILINDFFEMIGLCMTLEMGFKSAFINYGEKDTGKTQFSNIICHVIGPENMSFQELYILTERFGSTGIQFKILNYCADMSNTAIKKTGMFTLYTGGDRNVPAEIKGGKLFDFPPTAKFWFNINLFPYIKDIENNAFFGRFILNEFPNIFSALETEFCINYGDLIINDPDEIQGIIHEAIKGLHRLYERKRFRPILKEHTKHVWNYKSNPCYQFVYDYCISNKNNKIERTEFWDIFFHIQGSGLSKQEITRGMGKLGYHVKEEKITLPNKKRTSIYHYQGLEWKDPKFIKNILNEGVDEF